MKTIRIEEFPDELRAAEFFESLDVSQGEIVVEFHGEPKAVLTSAARIRQRDRAKQRLFEMIEGIHQANRGLDSDEVLAELDESDPTGD